MCHGCWVIDAPGGGGLSGHQMLGCAATWNRSRASVNYTLIKMIAENTISGGYGPRKEKIAELLNCF